MAIHEQSQNEDLDVRTRSRRILDEPSVTSAFDGPLDGDGHVQIRALASIVLDLI